MQNPTTTHGKFSNEPFDDPAISNSMKSRWSDDAARQTLQQWAAIGEDFALRMYTARLLGKEKELVLHGGGNVSVKGRLSDSLGEQIDVVWVKSSGADLEKLLPHEMPALELERLRRLQHIEKLPDDAMAKEIRRALIDAAAATPSIETLLHAFLPHRFIDHSHADAVIILTNQPDGESHIASALGNNIGIIPYLRPGFELAKGVAKLVSANPNLHGVVLMQHGLLTFADDARTAYERHIEIVTKCEQYIAQKMRPLHAISAHIDAHNAAASAIKLAPVLRGAIIRAAKSRSLATQWVLHYSADPEILHSLQSPDISLIASSGPLTADHLVRTKAWPLILESFSPDHADISAKLDSAIADFLKRYDQYHAHHAAGSPAKDPLPRVIVIPTVGMFAAAPNRRDAQVACDIARQTLLSKTKAHRLGGFVPLSNEHLFDMEFRKLQTRKMHRDTKGPLEGQVIAISGGAGAIGAGIAHACANAGAYVAVFDLDQKRIDPLVAELVSLHGDDKAIGFVMDVTDECSVRSGFEMLSQWCGGVDVVVVNAGIAHVAPIESLELVDFRKVLDVNAVGSFLFLREGARLLKKQGCGGNIIMISTKNVAAPGRDFGAYSASKAAAHQLARVAALELAPDGIRVNIIAPDGVFGTSELPSGLWQTVGPDRAKSRGMQEKDLPEFYRNRNLLRAEVTPEHVGNAVVFFASNATPTTGAVLPVDGGLPDAFSR